MDKQGDTVTNKDNIIIIIERLIYLGIPSNMTGFCKLMAQEFPHMWVPLIKSSNFFYKHHFNSIIQVC